MASIPGGDPTSDKRVSNVSEHIVVDAGDPYGDGLMQYSPVDAGFVVRHRMFVDGQQEVVAFPVNQWHTLEELRARPRGLRGVREARDGENQGDVVSRSEKSLKTSVERSKRMVRLRCKAIAADRLLTFSTRANITDVKVWAKIWDTFRRRMSKLKNFQYVAVLERQKRGAWHIHVAVSGRQDWKILRAMWLVVLRDVGTDGGMYDSIKDFKKYLVRKQLSGKGRAMRHLIATYIAKYIGKDVDESTFNKKRYWTSKGIEVPEVQPWAWFGEGSNRGEVIQAAFDCADAIGADFDNAQRFWNRGIGVFWMATGNTA